MPPSAIFLPLLLVASEWIAAPARLSTREGEPLVVVIQMPRREEPAVETETFVLEHVDADGRARVLGSARWLRRSSDAELQLELETAWIVPARTPGASAGLVRVYHVERHDAHGRRLVWREVGASPGRALVAEARREHSVLRTSEWTARDTCLHELAFPTQALLPLELLEQARAGRWTNGPIQVFDPLAREVASVLAYTPGDVNRPTDGSSAARVCAVHRTASDGSAGALVTRWRFEGARLTGFDLASGARARAIDRAEFETLEARLVGASSTSSRSP